MRVSMKPNSSSGRAPLACAVVLHLAACAAPSHDAGTRPDRPDAIRANEPAKQKPCAGGWIPVHQALCVRFSGLEQGNSPPVDLVAMSLVSKTDYAHLGLRVAVFRGPEKWCAFPGVLSLAQVEANHEYAFRVPCALSGKPLENGEFRLAVEVDEAIEKHSAR